MQPARQKIELVVGSGEVRMSHRVPVSMSKALMSLVALCLVPLFVQSKPVNSDNVAPVCNTATQLSCYGRNCCLRISPTTPTIHDVTRITVFGNWPDTCVPKYDSWQFVGREIRINFVDQRLPWEICALAITGWGHTVETGILPEGWYEAVGYINGYRCNSTRFFVFKELNTLLFLPIVIK